MNEIDCIIEKNELILLCFSNFVPQAHATKCNKIRVTDV